ncbi:PREDICTED: uncharacterized protein LOC108362739 [Rhagoletis zephyria]|uniref:uncharacterized protein LOC108362739 n=1 Tax=Rhagoletis zephyria TaxID=28612 RepID=UPI00081133B8|nr:PREDICTED: uncharacterized protein LOC108362739 [Rhagoletis zephyria]
MYDGTDIDDDETLEAFLEEKATLLLLNTEEKWTPDRKFIDPAAEIHPINFPSTQPSQTSTIFMLSDDEIKKISQTQSINNPTKEILQNQSSTSEGICATPQGQQNLENIENESVLLIFSEDDCMNNSPNISNMDSENARRSYDYSFKANPQAVCDMFQNFEIPWAKLPNEVLNAIKN